jgi:hypothetical protein
MARARKRRATTSRPPKAVQTHAATATDGARTIIYVHGIGNKPIQSILKCQWDNALFDFDLGERSRLAYWVNREYYPEPTTDTCQSGDTVRLEDEPTGRGLNVKRRLATVSLTDEVTEVTEDARHQRLLLTIARKMQTAGAPPRPWGAGAAASARRSSRSRACATGSRKLTRAFLRDVNDYFFVPARREAMRRRRCPANEAGGRPFVVIGHSQGSMIAYDVPRAWAPTWTPLFVTIGSPLGISARCRTRSSGDQPADLAVPAVSSSG